MLLRLSNVAATSLRVLPRKRISRALGQLARIQPPQYMVQKAIDLYCSAYRVDLSEVDIPNGGFTTFDAFFTRRLIAGSRPIDPDPNCVVSPSDGVLQDVGALSKETAFSVKGHLFEVSELIGDQENARAFEGGLYAVIYLHPRDYHRVHAPVDGPIEALRYVAGTLFPVNAIGIRHIPKLLTENERVVFFQQNPIHGLVSTIMVGAIGVGRISVSFDEDVITNSGRTGCVRVYNGKAPQLQRGSELGVFHLGSTAIVLLPRDDRLSVVKQRNERVRMGEAIARKTSSA